jgi:N-acetylglucosamine-6-phosphate deacetylase
MQWAIVPLVIVCPTKRVNLIIHRRCLKNPLVITVRADDSCAAHEEIFLLGDFTGAFRHAGPVMNEGGIAAWHYATHKPVRVAWKNGVITAIENLSVGSANVPSASLWIAPALFDVQVNGYGGIDFQRDDFTADDLLTATRKLREHGCGKFFLTLITADWNQLTSRFKRAKKLRAESSELRSAIVGWHIEGPFMSSAPGFHGAHDPTLMLDPTTEKIDELCNIGDGDPLLLTVSPERPGAMDAIKRAVARGAKVSLGHTNASAEILKQAVDAGATGFTHLGNGSPRDLDRHDNILWRVFETPGLTVSLIPDKIHVSPPLFRLVHRTLKNIFYTTDAMSAAGAGPGRYKLGAMDLEVGEDQVVRLPGKTNFAGSALRPIDGVFRAAEMLSVPWQETWKRAAETPAQFMGLKNEIAEGQPMNLCLIDVSSTPSVKLL